MVVSFKSGESREQGQIGVREVIVEKNLLDVTEVINPDPTHQPLEI